MTMSYVDRRRRLIELLTDRGLDGAVVTDLVNVRYLCGFTGSNGALLVRADGDPVFATDGRYIEQGAVETGLEPVLVKGSCAQALVTTAVDAHDAGRLGLETDKVSYDSYQQLSETAGSWQLAPLARAVEALRTIKDDPEVDALRSACAISSQALEQLLDSELVGRTERSLARQLESAMLELGAEAIGFDTIMASGPHSSVPHHQPTDREVARGDLLKIDFGARVMGYHADCTRTFVVAREPAQWQAEIYAAVEAAQAIGVDHAVVGTATKDVDAAVVASLEQAGVADKFVHGLGHGVGLEIHEDPFLGAKTTGTLADRTTITIEPGVYLPGRGGVRIEDTLVVTADGPNILTTASKQLRVVG
ncbi:MAG: M24 family metallopeptidase [Nocardioidaceae bacterium]